jgi:hypothetical protein
MDDALAMGQALIVFGGLMIALLMVRYAAMSCVAMMLATAAAPSSQEGAAPADDGSRRASTFALVTSPDGSVGLGFRAPSARTPPRVRHDDYPMTSP